MDTKYLKRVALYVAAVLFSVAMVLYIGYHIYNAMTSKIATVGATEIHRDLTVRADAFIFREEVGISVSSAGQLNPSREDGTHVAAGSEVGRIHSVIDRGAIEQIRTLRKQLSLLEDYAALNRGAKDAAEIDLRIYELLTRIKGLAAKGDVGSASAMKAQLMAELNERQIASGEGDGDFESLISDVKDKISAESAKLGSVLETVYAFRSGWYYAEADGYEELFTPAALDSLTLSGYDSLINAEPRGLAGGGKLVTNHVWHLTVRLPSSLAEQMSEGESYEVAFISGNGEELKMNLERIITETGADDAVLVFSSGEIGRDFSFARRQSVDVTVKVISGFSVPRSAVRLLDGVQGVYVFDGVRAHFRRILVLKEFDDVYVVATEEEREDGGENTVTDKNEKNSPKDAPLLSQNELIITEGKGIYDGKVIA